MNLSEGERLILVMLCDIYKALDLKGAVDPDALKPLILSVESNGAVHAVNGAPGNHRNRTAVATEVSEILDMWSAIERDIPTARDDMRHGRFVAINDWRRDKIWKEASKYSMPELIQRV